MVINMNKKLALLGAGLLLTAATASAQRLVTGRVTDSKGEPLMGATVRVPGTKFVTTTDANGNFKLNGIPAAAKKITVSYIGMNSATVSVAGNVQVVLKDNELGEAVVIGYGSAKKVGTVVGSVKKVTADVVDNKPTMNVADALQGQVAGLNIQSNSGEVGSFGNVDINIRGIGSLSASSTPLIVVDGSPAGVNILQMLGPSDIESVTTLKDASATSIYGSRAANGVIFITTKKGRNSEKAQITLSQNVGWSQMARSIGNPMNADELLDFQLENGIIYPSTYEHFKSHGANFDWQKYMFDNAALMHTTDFSVRGGTEKTNYYVSASYAKQNGITYGSYMKRTTLRANLDSKVKDWLKIGLNQSAAYSENRANSNAGTATNDLYSPSTIASAWPRYWEPYTYADTKHQIWGSDSWGNLYDPLFLVDVRPSKGENFLYNGAAFVELTPVKGLTLRSQLGLYATISRTKSRILPSFAAMQGSTGSASSGSAQGTNWTITNTAEYKVGFSDNAKNEHNFTFLLGQEGIKYSSNSFTAVARGMHDDRLPELSAGTVPAPASSSTAKYEYLSFFGRVDYDLNHKYYANFTVRSDASSRFGKSNRTALFYSGGLMWDMMQESFIRPASSWLTNLQLKASVGSTGNSEIGNYTHLALAGTTQYNGDLGVGYGQFPNGDLGWEKQIQANVGITAGFFGKLTLDLNFYNRKTKDMLMSTPLPYTTGMSSMMKNIGEMSNRGVEVDLSYDIVRTRDWFVNFHTTYSYNSNKIDKLFYDLNEWPMKAKLVNYIKGKGLNYYMPIFAGIDENDGAPMWYKVGYKGDAGYTYNPETMTKDASQIESLYQDTGKKLFAPHNGGFGFQVSYKGLALIADFSYTLGKYMVNNDYFLNTSSSAATQGLNQDRDCLSMWKKPGDHAKLPAFKYNSQFDTHLLENSSYMRLKNLQLVYTLPKRWVEATRFFENVRFNFTGRNIFTVTKFRGVDPEVNSGLTVGNYPATRQYTLGVDVTF